MIAYGTPFDAADYPRAHYQWVGTFPKRYTVTGLRETCAGCGLRHEVWITDDAVWRRAPQHLHQLRLCVTCFRAWLKDEVVTIHLLAEQRMLPVPPAIQVVQVFDDWLTVMDDATGKPTAYGQHLAVTAPLVALAAWLRPFAGVWLGQGPAALQQFAIAHIKDGV